MHSQNIENPVVINIYQNKTHHKRKAKIGICLRAIHKARQKNGKIFILFTNNLSKNLRDKIISVIIIHGILKHSLLNYNYLLIMITQSSVDLYIHTNGIYLSFKL